MKNTSNTRIVWKETIVNLHGLKTRMSRKFPNSKITNIILNEPSEISVEELIGAVGVWLNILDESYNNLKFQRIKEVIK